MADYRYRDACPIRPGDLERLAATWNSDCPGCPRCPEQPYHVCHLQGLPTPCDTAGSFTFDEAVKMLGNAGTIDV